MYYLGILLNLAAFVAALLVLVKLFQTKGVGHGILGLICGLYTFIWGWMNAKKLNLMNHMIVWTVGGLVGYGLIIPTMLKNMEGVTKQIQEAAEKAQREAAKTAPSANQ